MTRRRRLAVAGLALALGGAAAVASPAAAQPRGGVLAPPIPAADFTLTDQAGRPFHMADTRGKVVLLSFLYTHCTDFCPFLAMKLRETRRQLGAQASDVVIVPVTTDPERDTPSVLAEYSRALDMYRAWHFVTGPLAEMRRVWKSYAIAVESAPGPSSSAASGPDFAGVARGLSRRDQDETVGSLIGRFGGGYEVGHDTPFLLVDRRGMVRAWLGADATPAEVARDVRALVAERSPISSP